MWNDPRMSGVLFYNDTIFCIINIELTMNADSMKHN